jgi:hypothetical protein
MTSLLCYRKQTELLAARPTLKVALEYDQTLIGTAITFLSLGYHLSALNAIPF